MPDPSKRAHHGDAKAGRRRKGKKEEKPDMKAKNAGRAVATKSVCLLAPNEGRNGVDAYVWAHTGAGRRQRFLGSGGVKDGPLAAAHRQSVCTHKFKQR